MRAFTYEDLGQGPETVRHRAILSCDKSSLPMPSKVDYGSQSDAAYVHKPRSDHDLQKAVCILGGATTKIMKQPEPPMCASLLGLHGRADEQHHSHCLLMRSHGVYS